MTIGFEVISPPISDADPVTTLRTPFGTPARSASSASASAENGVCDAGFSTTVQPSRQRRTGLARDHRQREVPRRDARDDADRLLDDDDALVGLVAGNRVAVDALGLLGEPLEKRRRVDDFTLGLGERFALLDGHEPRQVFLVLDHQLIPPAHDRRALLGRLLPPRRQRLLGGFDGRPRFVRAALRHCPDDLSRRGVVDVDRGARLRVRPRAVDVDGLAKQLGVLEGDAGGNCRCCCHGDDLRRV